MASGDPVDVQRQKRWPAAVSSTEPKVNLRPPDEDSEPEDDDVLNIRNLIVDPEVDNGFDKESL